MASLAELLRDPRFRSDISDNARDFVQSASNTAASNVTAPIDGLAWLLRKAGVPVPQAPIGGSDWANNAGLMAEPKNKNSLASLLGEAAGNIAPIAGYAKAPEIAGGLNQIIKNANAPDTFNAGWHGQRGAINLPGGGLSNSADDASVFAEKIKAMGKEYIPKIEEAGGGSVYLTVQKAPLTKAGEIAKNRNAKPTGFKARFADHPSYWGNSISSDPTTGNTLIDLLRAFELHQGQAPKIGDRMVSSNFSPADKYGQIVEKVFSDATSLRGNPTQKWVSESRPFTFFEP